MFPSGWRQWVKRALDNGRRTAHQRKSERPFLEILEPRVVPSFNSATGHTLSATEGTALSNPPVASFTTSTPGDAFTASIDWGDGTTTSGIGSDRSGSFDVRGTHTYADEFNALPVKVTITDITDHTQVTPTATANVAEADSLSPVEVTTGNVMEGQILQGTAGVFSDTYAAAQASDFTGTFDWGDGTTYSTSDGTATVTKGNDGNFTLTVSGHTYADEGTYTVKATLADDSPGTASLTQTGTLTAAEADTLAAAGTQPSVSATEGTSTGTVPVAVFTDSGYPGNSPSDFTASIDWGDGTTDSGARVTVSSAGDGTFTVSGSHTYADEGTFQTVVTLTDDAPGTASATATGTASVAEGDFGSLFPQTITPTEGQAFSGTVATFTDSGNPVQVASDFTATIDWGDGTTTPGTVTGASGGPFSIQGSHTYADEGTFTVLASFSDDPPSTLTNVRITSTATVAETDTLAAAATQTPATLAEDNGIATVAVATFTDPGYPGNSPSDLTATINWGDGTTTAGTVTGGSGTFTVSGSHAYADEGTFHPVVKLTDDSPGTSSATATGTITVTEADILTAGPVTVTATEHQPFSGPAATFTDTNKANVGSNFTATITWGDGTTTTGTVSGSGGVFTVSGSHTYGDEGPEPVSVIITEAEPGGATATASGTVEVAEGDVLTGTGLLLMPTAGVGFTGSVATFTDTDTVNVASDFTATIDWGDGTLTAGTVSGGTGAFTVSGSHTYAQGGPFTTHVTLSDDRPGTATTKTVGSAGVAPTVAAVQPGATLVTGFEFTPLTNVPVATFTFAPGRAPTLPFTASIDWGDGTTSEGTVTGSGGTFTVTGTHTYQDEGTFPITVTLTGSDNSTVTATSTAIIGEELGPDGLPLTSADERFISEVYRDLLHRKVDAAGLAFWTAVLAQDPSDPILGRAVVVLGVETSLEYRLNQVIDLYQQYLHRIPGTDPVNHPEDAPNVANILAILNSTNPLDPQTAQNLPQFFAILAFDVLASVNPPPGSAPAEELQQVIGFLSSQQQLPPDIYQLRIEQLPSTARSVERVTALLVALPEYFDGPGGGTNLGWLDQVFLDTFGRHVDGLSLATYLPQLEGAHPGTEEVTRQVVAQEIFRTGEYRLDLTTGYYGHFLDRPLRPDEPGFLLWPGLLSFQSDDVVLALILSVSPEYYNKTATG